MGHPRNELRIHEYKLSLTIEIQEYISPTLFNSSVVHQNLQVRESFVHSWIIRGRLLDFKNNSLWLTRQVFHLNSCAGLGTRHILLAHRQEHLRRVRWSAV